MVGEVIGDRIAEDALGTRSWITLTEIDEYDPASISVLMSAELVAQIDRYGRYGVTGTTLQVRGIYHQACSEHDGLPDIHATEASVMAHGVDHPDELNVGDFAPGIIAVIVGAILMWAFYYARERLR